jgi:phosphate transport system permease protein
MTRKEYHPADRVFAALLRLPAIALTLLLALIAIYLFNDAKPALQKFGLRFLTTSVWDPVQEQFGALAVIFGTVASSLIAIAISSAISIGTALFLNELAPKWLASIVGFLVEMLAAIPSVVYGLWGIFVLAPLLRI